MRPDLRKRGVGRHRCQQALKLVVRHIAEPSRDIKKK
jgi:hypothetical protein